MKLNNKDPNFVRCYGADPNDIITYYYDGYYDIEGFLSISNEGVVVRYYANRNEPHCLFFIPPQRSFDYKLLNVDVNSLRLSEYLYIINTGINKHGRPINRLIESIITRYSVPKKFKMEIYKFYQRVMNEKLTMCMKKELKIISLIYMVCKNNNVHFPLRKVCQDYDIKFKRICNFLKKLTKKYGDEVERRSALDVPSMVAQFCEKLGCNDEELIKRVMFKYNRLKDNGYVFTLTAKESHFL